MAQTKIRPKLLLYEIRKYVSVILGRPFTEFMDHQVFKPDQKILALWALDCAEHVLPFFEGRYPEDDRPKNALRTLQDWLSTGDFRSSAIRKASLSAHAAAKGIEEKDAVYAAHSAGQAVATAHVVTHSFFASLYAIRAVAARTGNVEAGLVLERNRQLEKLRQIVESQR